MEMKEDGKLYLKYEGTDSTGADKYAVSGTYEQIFDLGPSLIGTLGNIVRTTAGTNHVVSIQVAESSDGVLFGSYQPWSNTYSPAARYIKVQIKMTSNDTFSAKDIEPIELEENENLTSINLLVKHETEVMEKDASWNGGGRLYRKKIPRNEWVRIDKIN